MIHHKLVLVLSFFLLLSIPAAYAGFVGPTTVIEGQWGNGNTDFGFESEEPMDSFPGLIRVDESGNIIIGDGVNFRIKIYGSTGVWQKSFTYKEVTVPSIGGWPANLKVKAGVGIFSIYKKLQKYDYEGDLVWTIDVPGFMDFWIADDGGIWLQESRNKYIKYSPTGQLLKTYTERPLELGLVKEKSLAGGRYKYIAVYPEKTYAILSGNILDQIIKDLSGYLYSISKVDSGEEYWTYEVDKYSSCGKVLGLLKLPVTRFEPQVVERQQYGLVVRPRKVIEEYGQPVIAPNGDVYTWKRMPDTYSILKWTWQDDPNPLADIPDAPINLTVSPSPTAINLTWKPPLQDPGCVTGYEIARSTVAGGSYSAIGNVANGVFSYNDTSAEAGTTYYYRVRAVGGDGYSEYSNAVSGQR